MKKQLFSIVLVLAMVTALPGCAVVGGIFKAGMGVGVFIVIAVIALIIFLLTRIGKNK